MWILKKRTQSADWGSFLFVFLVKVGLSCFNAYWKGWKPDLGGLKPPTKRRKSAEWLKISGPDWKNPGVPTGPFKLKVAGVTTHWILWFPRWHSSLCPPPRCWWRSLWWSMWWPGPALPGSRLSIRHLELKNTIQCNTMQYLFIYVVFSPADRSGPYQDWAQTME